MTSAPVISKIEWKIINNAPEFQPNSKLVDDIKLEQINVQPEANPVNIPQHIIDNPTPINIFSLLFPDELWNEMVVQTNLYESQEWKKLEEKGKIKDCSRIKEWKETTHDDLKKYAGIILWSGLLSNVDFKGKAL